LPLQFVFHSYGSVVINVKCETSKYFIVINKKITCRGKYDRFFLEYKGNKSKYEKVNIMILALKMCKNNEQELPNAFVKDSYLNKISF
jgi:hypothetical protein